MNSSIIPWIRIMKSVPANGTFRSTHRLEKTPIQKDSIDLPVCSHGLGGKRINPVTANPSQFL
ncbi:hypothetical protein N9D23_03370 [Rubripirellula sp.]|jgi:hypothetical protein|nr:hypothetical protein [Rubripirellula sp.]